MNKAALKLVWQLCLRTSFFVSRVHMETTVDLMSICHLHGKDMNRHSHFRPKSVFTKDGIENSVTKPAFWSGSSFTEFPCGSD